MNLIKKWLTKEKLMKIEFCEKNLNQYLTDEQLAAFNSFLNQKSVEYKEFNCLSHCSICAESPYAVVDGKVVSAETMEGLLEKLKEMRAGQSV